MQRLLSVPGDRRAARIETCDDSSLVVAKKESAFRALRARSANSGRSCRRIHRAKHNSGAGAASMTLAEISERFRIPARIARFGGCAARHRCRGAGIARSSRTLGSRPEWDCLSLPRSARRSGAEPSRASRHSACRTGRNIFRSKVAAFFSSRPCTASELTDISVPVVIVESEKAALALDGACRSATGERCWPIATGGV